VQLALVATIVTAVLQSVLLSGVALLFMALVAVQTSARRLRPLRHAPRCTSPAIMGPAAGCLILLVLSGTLPVEGVAVLPAGGILIGGAMTATTLTGRRLLAEVQQRHAARSGLGPGTDRASGVPRGDRPRRRRRGTRPGPDQTRTVGLVTLPGAFVGMVLGGVTPLEAAAVQLVVLIGLLATEVAAALITAETFVWSATGVDYAALGRSWARI
jgi:putative ABC transport system permease protein